ncbi:hypothetical protein [Mycobacterium sp. MAA66]|uniref:hypothetical protein n=1 Tax=Mycobacterium sp. MAA66 TaxID=3156297 RepID=UPI0035152E10
MSGPDPDETRGLERDRGVGVDAADRTLLDEDTEEDTSRDEANAEASGTGDGADAPTERSLLRRIGRIAALSAVGVIVVGLLGSSVFFGWQLKQRVDTATAESAALEAARTFAVSLSSMDSGAIDKGISQVLDGATGDFKSNYSQASAQLRQLLIDNKAASHGVVVDAGIKSATKDRVKVLLFLDQSITNAVNPNPRIDRLRVVMTMELVDHRWLLSDLAIE